MTFDTLLVDLGDVLCMFDMKNVRAVDPRVLQQATHQQAWYDLEYGKLRLDEALIVGLDLFQTWEYEAKLF